MSRVYWKISGRTQADGRAQLTAWIKVSSKVQPQVRTNIYVNPEHFEVERENGGSKIGYVKVPKRSHLNFVAVKEAQETKRQTDELEAKIARLIEVMPNISKAQLADAVPLLYDVPIEEVSENIFKKEEPAGTMYDYLDAFLAEKQYCKGREAHYRSVMRMVHRWEAYTSGNTNVESMTEDDAEDLVDYIANEHNLQKHDDKTFDRLLEKYPAEATPKHKGTIIKARGGNTMIRIIKQLRTYWHWLNEKKITNNYPLGSIKYTTEVYGTPFYLTVEERNQIADYDLSARPELEVQRDIFIFQCLVGCRVGDLYKMKIGNIHNGVLEYTPHKTHNSVRQVKPRIPLNERAQALVAKYKGKDTKGRLFPFIAPQNYNEDIKAIIKACGIDRNVQVRNSLTGEPEIKPIYEVASSHMARRTFIGAAYKKVKDPNIIGRMSGHVEGSRAFNRYRDIDDDVLREVIDMIE